MIAREYLTVSRNAFFIGRGLDYFVCVEGALKLKEISYIQAEGFAGGELKHGTIALIEEGTPVFGACDTRTRQPEHPRKREGSRGPRRQHLHHLAERLRRRRRQIHPAGSHPALAPLVSVVPLQLIAYYAALHRGCDVDKPRNLAKSVTVE
ncbi:SIS domain-containing protein [Bacillus amyloliquefaciens]|uniref:SIS domain-containing protein n=1 Tax=Bacillus amyloliquefaciens TaxID=1390 RepID=UPI00200C58DA|nr:SIS domain-containing protein [Bacillus amyloliquefaciens]